MAGHMRVLCLPAALLLTEPATAAHPAAVCVMRMRMQLHLRTAPMSVGKMVRQSIELIEGTIAPPITTKEFAMLKKP